MYFWCRLNLTTLRVFFQPQRREELLQEANEESHCTRKNGEARGGKGDDE